MPMNFYSQSHQKLSSALRLGAMLGLSALISVAISSEVAAAGVAENVFREAAKYTVKVRARVEIAFIEDDVGIYEGAGFLVDAERGWIVTNAHVTSQSPATISVAFSDEAFVGAQKLYVDPYLDLAVLRVDTSMIDRPSASLECNESPSVGHPVGAFGHPWGLDFTGTRGIVSGVFDESGGTFVGLDAAINPGNSGGPLISLETGRVVGINTASVDDEDDQNTNFAVPMIFVCRVLKILESGQDPSPPQLPVVFYEPPRDRDALIVARSYLPDGLLDLRTGDEILAVGAVAIAVEADLIHALRGRLDEVSITVSRAGEDILLNGRLKPNPLITERLGVLVSGLFIARQVLRDTALLGADNGLMVHDVEPGSVGDDLEFDYWDILTAIGGKHYVDVRALYEDLKNADESLTIEVLRISDSDAALFEYVRLQLPIEDLELIAGQ